MATELRIMQILNGYELLLLFRDQWESDCSVLKYMQFPSLPFSAEFDTDYGIKIQNKFDTDYGIKIQNKFAALWLRSPHPKQ